MKQFKSILSGITLFICIMGISSAVFADTVALTFTGGASYGFVTDPLPNTVGWEFSLSAPVTVTKLGFFDFGADGLSSNHGVKIWNLAGNLLTSGLVTNADPLYLGFRWDDVSPVTLAAGTYRIGAEIDGLDNYFSSTNTQNTATPVSYIGGVFHLGGFDYPENFGYTNNGRFGPDFQFVDAAPVPEPGTMMLLGLGMAGLAVYGKRRAKKA